MIIGSYQLLSEAYAEEALESGEVVITATRTRRSGAGLSGDVSLEAGSFDTNIGSLGLKYDAGNFGLRFAVERKQARGHKCRDPWDPRGQGWELAEREHSNISLGGDLWLGESLLRIDFDYSRRDSLSSRGTQWYSARETSKYRVSWERPLCGFGEETVFSLEGYYFNTNRRMSRYRRNPVTMEFDRFRARGGRNTSDYGIMSQISTVFGNHHLAAGIDFTEANVDDRRKHALPVGPRKFEGEQRIYTVFINNEMHLGERVILNAELRYDHWESKGGWFCGHVLGSWKKFPKITDSAISPKGGIVYKLTEDIQLRASFSTGFRAPTLWHMYRTEPMDCYVYALGNPELRAERLDWSYDVGIELQPHETLDISLTFSQSQLSDFMGRETLRSGDPRLPDWLDPGGLSISQSVNVDKVDIHEVEAELELRFNERWSAFINHTFNVSRVGEHKENPEIEGNYLPWAPRHESVFGFTYDNPRLFTLNLTIENKSSRYTRLDNRRKLAGFHLVNMEISRELFEGMEAFVNIENLTNEKWMETAFRLAPPFNFLIGARYAF